MVKELKFKSNATGQTLITIRARGDHDITADLEITADGTLVYLEEDGKRKN